MDNDEDDFVNYNIKKKNKIKRKKDKTKYTKTCAIYGIFDCICCKKVENNVIDETMNQPSTSRLSTSEDDAEQNVNDDLLDDIIDVGTDCVPSTSNMLFSEEDNKNHNDQIEINDKIPEEYEDPVYKEPENSETLIEPEINILNEIKTEQPSNVAGETLNTSIDATPTTTSESQFTDETIANSSIKSEVLPVTEEEEEIDVVNIPVNDTQNILIENNYIETVHPEITQNEIKTEISDDENQIIDIINFDDTNHYEHLVNNLENTSTNMESTSNSNEDEIIDVENLNDDNPPQYEDELAARRLRRHRMKRRLMSRIIRVNHRKRPRLVHSVMTIDLINTSRDDNIIEIADSPAVSRKIPEVINLDDDDETEGDSELNATCSPRIGLGNCPVCLESLAKKEIMSTICGHVYCARCIKNVIKTTKKCPNCRKNLTLKSIHPLFI